MQRRYLEWDLLLIDILTLLLLIIVLTFSVPLIREILGLLIIFYFPGYVIIAVIFPRQKSLETTTRLALSLCLSIGAAVFIGLFLSVIPIGFTLNSTLITLSLFTLIMSSLAWYLRRKLNRSNIFKLKIPSFFIDVIHSFRKADWGYRTLVILLLCVIIGGLGSLVYIYTKPLPAQPFSEFYILGTGDTANTYPRELHLGEEAGVIITIVNHENQETSYSLQVKTDGTQLYDLPHITLKHEQEWQQEMNFTLWEAAKNQKVEFILNKHGTLLYETRHIWVNVSE